MATKKSAKKAKTPKEPQIIKTYKGFDKDLKCRGYQFEVGKTHEHNGKIEVCGSGFHSCEKPIDIFNYYPPATTRFCETEASGEIQTHADDSKICSSKITIGSEISLHKIIDSSIKFIFDRTVKTKTKSNTIEKKQSSNSGYRGAASNSGYRGAASNSGYRGAASNSGYSGAASNSGYRGEASNSGDSGAAFTIGMNSTAETSVPNSLACGVGVNSMAKGVKGSWIVLAEWVEDKNYNWNLKSVQTAIIDGKKLKENTWYKLVKGKIVKA